MSASKTSVSTKTASSVSATAKQVNQPTVKIIQTLDTSMAGGGGYVNESILVQATV